MRLVDSLQGIQGMMYHSVFVCPVQFEHKFAGSCSSITYDDFV